MNYQAARVAPEKTVFRPVLPPRSKPGFAEKHMSEFWEKYKDPRWQKKRLKIMERASFTCEACSDDATTLQVHHKFYWRDCDPWDYMDCDLVCLCETCHQRWHKAKQNFDIAISFIGLQQFQHIVGYAIGHALASSRVTDVDVKYNEPAAMDGLAKALGINAESIAELRDENGVVTSGALLAKASIPVWS